MRVYEQGVGGYFVEQMARTGRGEKVWKTRGNRRKEDSVGVLPATASELEVWSTELQWQGREGLFSAVNNRALRHKRGL